MKVVREALRNVVSRGWQTVLLSAVLTGVLLVPQIWTVTDLNQALATENRLQSAGGYVFALSSDGGIEPDECLLLRTSSGVSASGVLSNRQEIVNLQASPATSYRLWSYQGDVPSLVFESFESPVRAQTEVLINGATADELAIEDGHSLYTTAAVLRVQVERSAVRVSELGRALLSPTPWLGVGSAAVPADCYVEAEPEHYALLINASGSLLSSVDDPVFVREIITRDAFTESPWRAVQGRSSRRSSEVAAGLVVGVAVILLRLRYAEIGLYRILGLGRAGSTLVQWIELVSMLTLGLIFSASTTAMFVWDPHLDTSGTILRLGLMAGATTHLLAAGATLAIFLLMPRGSTLSLLKDR